MNQSKTGSNPTLWSEIVRAGNSDSTRARESLEWLCQTYRAPVYSFLRGTGLDHENACDFTQGFFLYFIQKNLAKVADPARGRFRNFLLGSLKLFVSNEKRRDQAAKRGGKVQFISLDEPTPEGVPSWEPSEEVTPERLFDRRWATITLEQAMHRLGEEYRGKGLAEEFEALRPFLIGESTERISALAERLQKGESTIRSSIFRMRKRFQEMVRRVVMETVSSPDQLADEMARLKAALLDS